MWGRPIGLRRPLGPPGPRFAARRSPAPRDSLHVRSHYLMKRCFSVVAVSLMVSLSSFAQSKQKIFHLAIGDPERRTRDARVVLDGITDADKGEVFSVNQLAARLHDTRLLLVGEEHTTADFHRVQLRVIRALHEAGRKVTIGLEMFPYTEQKALDNWRDGLLTEADRKSTRLNSSHLGISYAVFC